jgi:hypothetical protein
MYSTKTDSMTILISIYMWHQKTKTEALLDSGATHNFVDKRAIQSLGLGTQILPHALQINNVDGTINKERAVTEYCNLWVQQGKHTMKMGFYIANLGCDHVILGHPWFKAFNLTIDWTINQLTEPDICIQTAGY